MVFVGVLVELVDDWLGELQVFGEQVDLLLFVFWYVDVEVVWCLWVFC